MKKIIFFVILMFLSLGTTTVFAGKSDPATVPVSKENKLSEEEMLRLKNRVEEIRDMDKTNLTMKQTRELRKELRAIKETVKENDGGYIFIGGGTLLIIILILLLV